MASTLSGPVIVTGASGFIGGRLVEALDEADVVTLRRKSSPEPKVRSYEVDYGDVDGLTEVMKAVRPAYILHAAGATKGVTYRDFQRGNVMPTANLLAALDRADHRPHRFVLISSLTAYGPSEPDRPLVESDERAPIEYYGQSKAEAEAVVEASGLPFTILRPGGVYGPGDVDFFEHFKMAARGWSLFFGNRNRLWSGVYVDDLVEATFRAATTDTAEGRGYFIDDGHPATWEHFQRLVGAESGRKVREVDIPEAFVKPVAVIGEWITALDGRPRVLNRQKAKMGAQDAWTCSCEAARRDFGYDPKVALDEGVVRSF
ncbi:MAG: NAD-dependent epimerase/dehydratase family protein, partial [Myxococcota bacterium]